MYLQANELNKNIFYQGDLVRDFPFLIFNAETPLTAFDTGSETKLELKARLNLVMILSQTCDVQRRTNAIICPVYKMQDFNFSKDELEKIKNRRVSYWFYLPRLEGVIEDSVADFQTIYYVPRKLLEANKQNKITSLSDWGRHHIGWALSNYFARPIENKDNP